jgi:type III secretion protein L
MVIWLNGAVCNAGVEDGILPAAQVASLGELDALRRSLAEQREAIVQSAHDEAQALLTQARQQAAQLLESARVEAQRAQQQGYEEGRREAVLEWHEQQAGKSIDKAEALRRMHEKLAAIVTSAVERIVHTEERGALYQRALRSVQGLTRGASTLALRVNAADFEYARAALGSLQSLGSHGLSVDVSVDPALKPGSCIFESEVGILDASLQTQLDGLRAAMDRAVRKAVADSDSSADEYEASPSDTYHALAASAIDITDGAPGNTAFDEREFDDGQAFDESQDDELNDTELTEAAHE